MTIPEMLKLALDEENWTLVKNAYIALTGQFYEKQVQAPPKKVKPKTVKKAVKKVKAKKEDDDSGYVIHAKHIFEEVRTSSTPVRFGKGEFKNKFVDDRTECLEDIAIDKLLKPKKLTESRPEVEFIDIKCYHCHKMENIPISMKPPRIDVDKDGEASRYYCNKCAANHSERQD